MNGPQAEAFADSVRAALAERGETQAAFAGRIGVDASALTRLLRNGAVPVQEGLQRAMIQGLREIGVAPEPFAALAIAQGGPACKTMETLIAAGFVSRPGELNDHRLTIQEACMRPQLLRTATLAHFGIPADPFQEPESAQDVFQPPPVAAVRDWLTEAALRGERIAALTGEPGSGKTTLAQVVLDDLRARHNVKVIWPEITDKSAATVSGLQSAILTEATDRKFYHLDQEQRSRAVREAVQALRASGQRLLLVLDEAHDLPLNILHSLKRLHEMRDGFRKILNIWLLGQPELSDKLNNWGVREFTLRCVLREFPGLGKIEPYIRFRLGRAGCGDEAIGRIFPPETFGALEAKGALLKKAGGASALTPLAAQNLVSRCLNLAAEAGDKAVTPAHVDHVQDR